MTTPPDRFWDELGVEWAAINPEITVILPRLQSRLRRQSNFITAILILGLPLSLAAFVLGIYTIWIGWTTGAWNFVTRGVAFVAIAAILSLAISALLRVRTGGDAQPLSHMLDFAITRTEKTLFAIRLGFYASGVTALFGLVGTAIRMHLSRLPALSPLVDLSVLAIFALGLFFYCRRTQGDLAKYRYLKRVLALEEDSK
jgi:hypothetical protein